LLTEKVAFAKYFSTSAKLSADAWDNAASLDKASAGGSLTTCGICDNCIRDESTIDVRDVTLDSWKLLKVAEEVQKQGGKLTVTALGDLARGLGGGQFTTSNEATNSTNGKLRLDIGDVAAGKVLASKSVSLPPGVCVQLTRQDTERLIVHLLLLGYLEECKFSVLTRSAADHQSVLVLCPNDYRLYHASG
jgi:ATP-dependent DNA helicase Q1